jgi:dCMP deaminase
MEKAKLKHRRMERPEAYMQVAEVIAKRSSCNRAQVGAVLIDPITNHIVAMGYNGSGKGSPHCTDVGCLMHRGHCVRTIHAELNAVLHLEHQYENLHLYCTHKPCYQCLKALVGARVTRIIYKIDYKDIARDKLLKEMPQIRLVQYTP